jgi:DNA repair protein RadC
VLPHIRHYADRKQEHFLCAGINGANEILNIRVVSIGLIDRTPVHPREVFADALSDRASDVEITEQLNAAGIIMGIALLDHIIFNRNEDFSFLEAARLLIVFAICIYSITKKYKSSLHGIYFSQPIFFWLNVKPILNSIG